MGFVFLIIAIAVIYLLVKPHGHGFSPLNNAEAEEVLKKRYVSGDIDEETYLRMLNTLRK